MYSNNVLDIYPPGEIPAEDFGKQFSNQKGLTDLVSMVKKAHKKKGKDISSEEVISHLDKLSDQMGLGREEGRGLFGDIGRALGHVVKSVGHHVASHLWNKFQEDPLNTIANAVNLGTDIASTVPVI